MLGRWNIRGLKFPFKQSEVRQPIVKKHLVACGIIETRFQSRSIDKMWSGCRVRDWELIHNDDCHPLGRIWNMYDPNKMKLVSVQVNAQWIHCSMLLDSCSVDWTLVYGFNDARGRSSLWNDIRNLEHYVFGSWVLQEDFNAMIRRSDKLGGISLVASDTEDVKQFFGSFSRIFTEVLEPGLSDHSPLVVNLRSFERGKSKAFLKLKAVKKVLQGLNRREYASISERVYHTRQLVKAVQRDLQRDPMNSMLLDEERALVLEFRRVLELEKSFYFRKSRVNWMEFGDTNTAILHNSVKVRSSHNVITSIKLPTGEICTDQVLLCRSECVVERDFGFDSQAGMLNRDVSTVEIRDALWSIGSSKAPGIDDFNAYFFKKNWSLVGEDFTEVVLSFFSSGCLAKQFVISKILTARLALIQTELISPLQSAFVDGSVISDNILVAHELIRGYHKDLACTRSVSYSLMINGAVEGYFEGKKGVCQGDPISPLLFILAMEYLSRSLASPPDCFKFHLGCTELRLSHLCFVDDLFLFCHGDIILVNWLMKTLSEFSDVS
ncbi:uncharacterized protein [Rutidosis leptorrhynchoides]|uniref:uncharacterized protein n=1 Tax=Rutidosis leptorrhynchoides TaxID=125765 RepID=UPI003A991594